MAIQSAMDWLATTVQGVTGVSIAKSLGEDATPNNTVWAMVFPGDGTFTTDSWGSARDLHNIRILLGTARGDLRATMLRLKGLPEAIADAVRADPSLGGSVETFGSITYVFSPGVWMDVPFLGYVFTVTDVKVLKAITMS